MTYGYDAADRLTSVTQGAASVGLTYDAVNRRSTLTLPNGIVVSYSYDADSQVTALTYTGSGGSLGNLTYTYDAAGRRTTVGGSWARTGLPPALAAATYDAANQIATWNGTPFTYDANGNLTSDGATAYTWNARDQLTALTGAATASFTYDAAGRRTSRSVAGVTTGYLYDGLDAVQEQIGGTPSANYLLGLNIDERFARTDGTGTSYYLSDVLQSTVALADPAALVQTTYTYEPYGATTQSGAGSANPARYTGREEDGTGLYYYRARYYDPRRQRFVSEDPIGIAAGDTNFFRYAMGQPTMGRDPFGLDTIGIGPTVNVGFGVGASIAVVVTVATSGDIGIQITGGVQGIAGGGASVAAIAQWSNAGSLGDLAGWFVNAGGSIGVGPTVGVDWFGGSNEVHGGQAGLGIGARGGPTIAEGHAGATYTYTWGCNVWSLTCGGAGGGRNGRAGNAGGSSGRTGGGSEIGGRSGSGDSRSDAGQGGGGVTPWLPSGRMPGRK